MTPTGAPLPADEARRLLDLARYQVLDSGSEADFDRITRLAAQVLRVPVAVLNLVDQHRQWGKAMFGTADTTLARQHSFCAWTILGDAPFVVEDAPGDPRFRLNPMVTGAPHIHMYAGAPLITPAGHRIGTLCVTDSQPHPLTAAELEALQDLAATAMQLLELRRQSLEAQQTANAQEQQAQELRRTLDQARVLEGVSSLMDLELDPEQATLSAASILSEALEADDTCLLTCKGGEWSVRTASQPIRAGAEAACAGGSAGEWTAPGALPPTLQTLDRPLYWHREEGRPSPLPAALGQVAWVPLGEEAGARRLLVVARRRGHRVERWRTGDRTLLEAAGRTIRHAWQRHAALQLAQRQARQDALTGLLNRRAFDEDLRGWEAGAHPFTLALIDLDGLKAVNDREGHA